MIRLVIADDHPIIIDGIMAVLDSQKEIKLIGTVCNGVELLDFIDKHKVDVVLMDVNMPKLNGIDATKIIKEKTEDINILAFSQYNERRFVKRMLKNGATGYLLKNSSASEILEGIKTVADGKIFLSNELNKIFANGRPKAIHTSLFPNLSRREIDVIALIAEGLNTPEIAKKLDLSYHTVESHRSNLLQKVGTKNSAGLIKWAAENDII